MDAGLDHATKVLLAYGLSTSRGLSPPSARLAFRLVAAATQNGHLYRQHAHVDEGGPKTARQQPDERSEEPGQEPDRRDHEEPPVGDHVEVLDLVAEWKQLLRDAKAVAELGLPVDDRARK